MGLPTDHMVQMMLTDYELIHTAACPYVKHGEPCAIERRIVQSFQENSGNSPVPPGYYRATWNMMHLLELTYLDNQPNTCTCGAWATPDAPHAPNCPWKGKAI